MMDMPIERKNSFHLLLSDDELELLRLLAEREGLNMSDFLRTRLRQLAGAPAHLAVAMRASEHLGHGFDPSPWAGAFRAPKQKKRGR